MSKWKEYTLGKLIDEGRANLQTGPFGTMLSASEYSTCGIPVIAVQDIGENKLLHHKFVFVNQEVANRLSRYRVLENDIIFGRKGAVERRALIKKDEEGWLQGSDCIRLRLDNSIDPKFISYQMGSNSHKDWMFQYSTGATMPSLNQEILRLLPLKLPSLQEQHLISSILSSLDVKIDLLHRQNKTLEQLAETLFRQWFVEDSNWDGKLSEYIKVQGGFAFKSQDFKENGFAGVIKITNISMGFVDIIKTQFVDKEVVKEIDEDKFRIKSGDFLIAMTGAEIGKIGIVENTKKQLWLNQRVGKLIEKVPWGNYVGYLALKSRQGQDYITNTCSGSAQENISPSSIEGMDFTPYSEEKTNNFGVECKSLFDKIIFNMEQIKTLSHLRDTLLPKLMSGEVRVN